jgi:DNA-binding GntR family transcriptional regulator
MPYEYTPPKYAQVVAEIQRRIESGEYPPGSLLPSEHQLSDEFQIARPTAVRALRLLRQDGWIDTQQGKGSFVRGRPALAGLGSVRPGEEALSRDESREPGELIEAGVMVAPPRVAELLAGTDGEALARRRLVRHEKQASEILTWWVPVSMADGTDLAGREPVQGGVRAHLERRKGVRIDHVLEQVVARHPLGQEAKLLGVGKTAPMLVLYVAAREASGNPVFVLELVMPGDRHELEDAYQVG